MINNIIGMKNKYKLILFLVIFFPFVVLLLFGKVIYWGTASLQFIPWYQFFFDSILSGHWPLWNPYNGMGVPFIANYQSAVFYPINWLLLIFYLIGSIEGIAIGVTLLIPLHLFISGLGIMRILEHFEKSRFAQLMGGIVFALSGYILTRLTFISMVWAYAWLPWIIFSCLQLKSFSQQGSIPKLMRLSLFLALQLLSGHAQTTYYTILLGGIFVIAYEYETFYTQIKKLLAFLTACLIAFLISAVQILPTAEFLMQSQRSSEVGYDFAVSLSLWPARLLTILFGNFWGNPNTGRFLSGGNFWEENLYSGVFPVITMIILVWVLLWKTRRKQTSENQKKTIALFFALLVFSILFSLGKFFPLFPFLYQNIPTFDLFQAPVRFLIIYFFAFSILFGYGVDVWILSKFNNKKTMIILVIFGTLFLISFYGKVFQQELPNDLIMSVLIASILGLIFGILTLVKDNSWIRISIIKLIFGIIVIGDLLFHNLLWENFQPFTIFPDINQQPFNAEPGRVFISAQDEDFLKFNVFFRPDRLQSILDFNKIQPNFLPDTNLLNHRYAMINNFDPLQPEKFTKFWQWLNSLSSEDLNSVISLVGVNTMISIDPTSTNFLSEQTVTPEDLIQWYGCSTLIDEDKPLNSLLHAEVQDSDNRCIFVNDISQIYSPETLELEPVHLNFSMTSMNSITVNYASETPGWIVIRQNWYPGWKAILDEEELAIEEVDYLFQGIYVPAGHHSLALIYNPQSFRVGFSLSLITLFILLIWKKLSKS
jgi:hypothetical protein